MAELSEFFHMGGYAFYVWFSYGLTLLVLSANILWSSRQLKQVRQKTFHRALQQRAQS